MSDSSNDRLSEALKRAEAAVQKSNKGQEKQVSSLAEPKPSPKPAAPKPSPAAEPQPAAPAPGGASPPPSFGEIDLGAGGDPAPASGQARPGGANPPPAFGEVDLGAGSEGGDLELESAQPAEAPKPKKPAIKKPALLQDEDYDDDGWAEGKQAQKPAEPPAAEAKPAGDKMKVRRATPGGAPPSPADAQAEAPAAEQAAEPAVPVEREGPSIRVSSAAPPKDWGPAIKILLIAILAVGLIGGGIFGYLKWKESAEAEEQAQLNALDQGSLDALKKEALRKEQLGS